jgi:hypothetical protein
VWWLDVLIGDHRVARFDVPVAATREETRSVRDTDGVPDIAVFEVSDGRERLDPQRSAQWAGRYVAENVGVRIEREDGRLLLTFAHKQRRAALPGLVVGAVFVLAMGWVFAGGLFDGSGTWPVGLIVIALPVLIIDLREAVATGRPTTLARGSRLQREVGDRGVTWWLDMYLAAGRIARFDVPVFDPEGSELEGGTEAPASLVEATALAPPIPPPYADEETEDLEVFDLTPAIPQPDPGPPEAPLDEIERAGLRLHRSPYRLGIERHHGDQRKPSAVTTALGVLGLLLAIGGGGIVALFVTVPILLLGLSMLLVAYSSHTVSVDRTRVVTGVHLFRRSLERSVWWTQVEDLEVVRSGNSRPVYALCVRLKEGEEAQSVGEDARGGMLSALSRGNTSPTGYHTLVTVDSAALAEWLRYEIGPYAPNAVSTA